MQKKTKLYYAFRSLIQIFEDKDAGTPEDKLRLFLIYYLCTAHITDTEVRIGQEKRPTSIYREESSIIITMQMRACYVAIEDR